MCLNLSAEKINDGKGDPVEETKHKSSLTETKESPPPHGDQRAPRMSSMCAYCLVTSCDVQCMATCMAKCSVMAHPECFEKRFITHVFRKKHSSRGNEDFELCPLKSCNAKLKVKSRKGIGAVALDLPDIKGDTDEIVLDDTMCGYPMKDGRLCTRLSTKDGACKLHAHDAIVMKKMVSRLEDDALCVACTPPIGSVSVGTQCDAVTYRGKAVQTETASTTDAFTQTRTVPEVSPDVAAKLRRMEEENVRLRSVISSLNVHVSDATIKNDSDVAAAITATRRRTLAEVSKTIERMRLQ
jgi:hypothetical protein